ncbi:MAG TPA: RHS repeat-associated core domain-containing protein, partial [Candidatus Levybacteria bacterium]|nr:RHS repeat-associated core domain-containing protein [Candidatus Levybacteria bacterium]
YYNARYYSSDMRRFTQPDDIIQDVYNPQSLNRYSYVLNNPLKYTDPSGHIVDTLFDVAFILYDIRELQKDPNNHWDQAALGADVVGALIPFGSGLGLGVKVIEKGGDINKVISSYKEVLGGGKISSNVIKQESKVTKIADKITGYTNHGLNQAIGRDGGKGVAPKAILDAVRNPIKTVNQTGGVIRYVGNQAVVVLNKLGKIITTWSKGEVRGK